MNRISAFLSLMLLSVALCPPALGTVCTTGPLSNLITNTSGVTCDIGPLQFTFLFPATAQHIVISSNGVTDETFSLDLVTFTPVISGGIAGFSLDGPTATGNYGTEVYNLQIAYFISSIGVTGFDASYTPDQLFTPPPGGGNGWASWFTEVQQFHNFDPPGICPQGNGAVDTSVTRTYSGGSFSDQSWGTAQPLSGTCAPSGFVFGVLHLDMQATGVDGAIATNRLNGTMLYSTVPEPSSLALIGTGLLGVVAVIRRRLHR